MSLSDHLFLGGVLGRSDIDHPTSHGSLAYQREKGQLIAVNAGSNTITVLAGRRSSPRPARWRSRPKAASCS